MSDKRHLLARLARADVNMPLYDGSDMDFIFRELRFEATTYALLQREPTIPTSRLLYHRVPAQYEHIRVGSPRVGMPKDIAGRRLMVFERAEGENNVWDPLNSEGKVCCC